jgi:hypothetical protein
VELVRVTSATGGVLTTSSPVAVVSNDGKTLEFSIQVVVVNERSEEVKGLPASAFSLRACTPDAATTPENDCLAASTGVVADWLYCARPGSRPVVPGSLAVRRSRMRLH